VQQRLAILSQRAFSLLEVMTAIMVIAILAMMSIEAFSSLGAKAERANCQQNLKSLYVAASAHTTDHSRWPQIGMTDPQDPEFALAWIEALRPYGIAAVNWVCPTTQHALGNIDYKRYPRVDYFGTPFDDSPRSPFLYPTHPWFLERGDVHGDGNMAVFGNGQIRSLNEVLRESRNSSSAP
jgi:prepilin-type N-terminal cleavage/methylation domain-containing protein